jgi:hypothetical protein
LLKLDIIYAATGSPSEAAELQVAFYLVPMSVIAIEKSFEETNVLLSESLATFKCVVKRADISKLSLCFSLSTFFLCSVHTCAD